MSKEATSNPTLRERALQALVSRFKTQQEGLPTGQDYFGQELGYEYGWSDVVRWPLGEREFRKRFCMAVLDGPERKVPMIGYMDCIFTVTLEFCATLNAEEEPAEWLNMILGEMQRRLRQDFQLGGLVDNVVEVGNDVAVDSFDDRKVGGVLSLQVRYKHAENDPRRRV